MERASGSATGVHLVLVGAEPSAWSPGGDGAAEPAPGLARVTVRAPARAPRPLSAGRSLPEVLDRIRRDAAAEPARWLAEAGVVPAPARPGPRR